MNIEELAFKDRITLAQLNELVLLDIIEFLQLDRKQWISQFTQTHNESIDIQKENQELKEQNKKEFADYIKFKKEQYDEYLEKINKLIKENQELKKQLENNSKIQERMMYRFIFTFIETNKYGSYWNYEINKRKVEIIAKDKNEALQKLEKIGVHNYKDLQWDAIEIIGDDKE